MERNPYLCRAIPHDDHDKASTYLYIYHIWLLRTEDRETERSQEVMPADGEACCPPSGVLYTTS